MKNTFTQDTILQILSNYSDSGRLEQDFYAITPDKRLALAEKLIDYALPKIKSVEAEPAGSESVASLSERLNKVLASHTENTGEE